MCAMSTEPQMKKSVWLQIRVDPKMKAKLEKLARAKRRTMSDIIREMLEQAA